MGDLRGQVVEERTAADDGGRLPFAAWAARLLLAAQVLAVFWLVRDALNAGTFRFYLDQRTDESPASTARQRFQVAGRRVVPQILTSGADRFRFGLPTLRRAALRVDATAAGPASFAITVVQGASRRVVARGDSVREVHVDRALPRDAESLEIETTGTVVWSDLRVVEGPLCWLHLGAFALLVALGAGLRRRWPGWSCAWSPRERSLLVRALTAGVGGLLALLTLELGLRVLSARVPTWMASQRAQLGEVAADPHWMDSPRYGRIPRPLRDDQGAWRHGDIVRMGFIPAAVSPSVEHRFPIRTDADGFRNAAVRERIDVAALGDSFTDALTLPEERAWPALLEARLGRSVQNYGVAGFGPPQELRVLVDHALRRRPRVVVLAFFAGNDIPGAALFDDFERRGGRGAFGVTGWPFKRVVARFDELYVTSLADRLLHGVVHAAAPDDEPARGDDAWSGEDPGAPAVARPSFDRGLFAVPGPRGPLRFALMPPYLNLLNLGRAELAAHPGWPITQASLTGMANACRAQDAQLVVMFIPSKSQVYLPLLERSFPPDELRRALAFSLPDDPWHVDVSRLLRNRLAQNRLLRDFCAAQGIAFLDLTPALSAALEDGTNVYFPDDSHWNAAGHRIAAETVAARLQDPAGPFLAAFTP